MVAEPVLIEVEPETQRWVEIRDVGDDLVTVIEILSRSNKGRDRDAYIAKRRDLVDANVNLVEIDLLRDGQSTVDALGHSPENSADYAICVSRQGFRFRRELCFCDLPTRLPIIRVPLRDGDPDGPLDLQHLIDRCYENGRYFLHDFSQALTPSLQPRDAEWINDCLQAADL